MFYIFSTDLLHVSHRKIKQNSYGLFFKFYSNIKRIGVNLLLSIHLEIVRIISWG